MDERRIYADDYFRAVADDRARVVRLVRSSTPFPTLEAAQRSFDSVASSMIGLPATGWGLLVDTRDAPVRNDEGFEEILARARGPIVARFGRAAILVASSLGKLQMARYAREDPRSPPVFGDKAEALAYITAGRG